MYAVSLSLTYEEAEKLARLIGHHAFGFGLSSAYERLVEVAQIETIGAPYDDKGKLEHYGDRPMVRVD